MPEWPRIATGVELIVWSGLAQWNGAQLIAETDRFAFNARWKTVDSKFGRWLCWVAFSVGAENIVRGAFGQRYKGKFGLAHSWEQELNMPKQHVTLVSESIKWLAKIRNRDAHGYVAEVRDGNFPDVASRFVPALNHICDCLDAREVKEWIPRGSV